MSTIDEVAFDRILKVRANLIKERRFYGVLVSHVEPVPSRKFPTMATNSKQHFFNPDFIATLSYDELYGVQAHETEHDARHHGTRRNGRDPIKWNEACDYAINIDLIDEGFTLPKGALIDPRFRGLSAEDIYRIRELEAEQKRRQQEQEKEKEQEQPDDGDDDGEQGGSDAPDDADSDPGDDDGEQGSGDAPDDADTDEDQGDGDDSSDAGEDGDQGEGDQGEGDEPGDEPSNGSSDADDGEGDATDTGNGDAGEPGDADSDEQGNEGQSSSGDPGQCGEVLDSSEDATELADKDIEWEKNVRQAASMAKAIGQLPGHVSRDIERANNPPRDWRDELREFCEQGALRVETWNRPNRRHQARGLIMPSTQKDGVSKAVFLIDTSGSMDDIALAAISQETQALLDDGIIDEVVAVYGDTQVTRVDEYRTGDDVEFDPRGGGGTNLKPLFAHVAQNVDDATLIVCFTDLDIGDPGPEPHCPVLFAVTGHPVRVRAHLESTPWNARGIDVGERH
jgi:predicted metal-dependent peptidase